jgi:hypothetical protein
MVNGPRQTARGGFSVPLGAVDLLRGMGGGGQSDLPYEVNATSSAFGWTTVR